VTSALTTVAIRHVGAKTNALNRGILADVIVYLFAHLHTALLAERNMLDIN